MTSGQNPKHSRKKIKAISTTLHAVPARLYILENSRSGHSRHDMDKQSGIDRAEPVSCLLHANMQGKTQRTKDMRAASQRRYYQRNKRLEQEKGRLRASNKRSKAKLMATCSMNTTSLCSSSPSRSTPSRYDSPPSLTSSRCDSPLSLTPSRCDSPPASTPSHCDSPPSSTSSRCNSPPALTPPRCDSPPSSTSSRCNSPPALTPPRRDNPPSSTPPRCDSLLYSVSPPTHSPDSIEADTGLPGEIYLWWPSWSARRRIAGLRRWMLDVEWQEGEFTAWNASLMVDWAEHRADAKDGTKQWSDVYVRKVKVGRLILQYLGRVMDGNLLVGVGLSMQEECRDLALQIHQLTTPLSSAVAGLEVSLKWAQM